MTLTQSKETREASSQPTAASRRRRDAWQPWKYLLPALVLIVGMLGYPVVYAIWTSLNRSVLTDPDGDRFVGLKNYVDVLTDGAFYSALGNTVVWVSANLVLQLAAGMALALLLHQRMRGRALYRSVVIIPWVVPSVVVAVIWRFLLDPTAGPFNQFLVWLGVVDQAPLWLADKATAMPVIIVLSVWKWTPFSAVILLAGLQSVPHELHEAAMIDGCGAVRRFRYVTVPGIRTSLLLVSLLTIGYSVNNFNGIWLFTKGGPVGATETLTTLAYKTAFTSFDLGHAAAIAMILFAGVLVVSTCYFFVVEGRKGRKL